MSGHIKPGHTMLSVITLEQQDIVRELLATGLFDVMTPRMDEDEHSIEMHLPFIKKVRGVLTVERPLEVRIPRTVYLKSLVKSSTRSTFFNFHCTSTVWGRITAIPAGNSGHSRTIFTISSSSKCRSS